MAQNEIVEVSTTSNYLKTNRRVLVASAHYKHVDGNLKLYIFKLPFLYNF